VSCGVGAPHEYPGIFMNRSYVSEDGAIAEPLETGKIWSGKRSFEVVPLRRIDEIKEGIDGNRFKTAGKRIILRNVRATTVRRIEQQK